MSTEQDTEQTDMCILALGARLAPVGQPLATGSFVHLSYCSVSWKEGEEGKERREKEGEEGKERREKKGEEGKGGRVRKVNTPSLTNLGFHLLHVIQPCSPLFTGAWLMGLCTASPVGECEGVRV